MRGRGANDRLRDYLRLPRSRFLRLDRAQSISLRPIRPGVTAMKPALLAVAFVLVGSVDYGSHWLIARSAGAEEHICTVSGPVCEYAIEAIRAGRALPDLRGDALSCEPANGQCRPGDDGR